MIAIDLLHAAEKIVEETSGTVNGIRGVQGTHVLEAIRRLGPAPASVARSLA
jgi:hypothetical protein